jgi:hypothetical protein
MGLDEVPVTEAPTALALTWSRPTETPGTGGRYVGSAVAPVISGECPQRTVKKAVDGAVGGRDNTNRQVVALTPSSRVAELHDQKLQLEWRNLFLGKEIEDSRTATERIEAALEIKIKATIASSNEDNEAA